MDNVEDSLLTLQVGESGNGEIDRSVPSGRTIFALRGFGEYQARCGIGRIEKSWAHGYATRRRTKRGILASGVRCLATDRMAYGLSTLELGASSKGKREVKPPP